MKQLFSLPAILCLAVGLLTGLPATVSAGAAPLSLEDKEEIARAEAYFNKFTTMTADFMQISPEGKVAMGEFFMKRPGRMRFEYLPPANILVVADGTWLVFHDKEIDQTTRIPLSSTPVNVLLQGTVRLTEDAEVTAVRRDKGTIRIDVRDRVRPDEGMITLVFSDRPYLFRKWLVRDQTGNVTSISISSVRKNVELKPELFIHLDKFEDDKNR